MTPRRARELVKATQIQPDNPRPWLWLGRLDFHAGRYRTPSPTERVLALDQPTTRTTLTARSVIAEARAQLAQRPAAAKRSSRPAIAAPGSSSASGSGPGRAASYTPVSSRSY